jgi:hypothetical protein
MSLDDDQLAVVPLGRELFELILGEVKGVEDARPIVVPPLIPVLGGVSLFRDFRQLIDEPLLTTPVQQRL